MLGLWFFVCLVLGVFSSLSIILQRKRERELVALHYVVAVCVLCLFLAVPWLGLQSVNVAFRGHTQFLFTCYTQCFKIQALPCLCS